MLGLTELVRIRTLLITRSFVLGITLGILAIGQAEKPRESPRSTGDRLLLVTKGVDSLFEVVDRVLDTLACLIAQFLGLVYCLVEGVTYSLDSSIDVVGFAHDPVVFYSRCPLRLDYCSETLRMIVVFDVFPSYLRSGLTTTPALTGAAFADGDPIPETYAYTAQNVNSPLEIGGVPEESK